MTDTFEQARDRIFEEFGIERPRLTFFGIDLLQGDCGNVTDVFRVEPRRSSKVSPFKCELAPQKPGDYGWPL